MATESPSYWSYLRLPELLSLQSGLEDDEFDLATDELHFILVHQVFELWFKLVIRELMLAAEELSSPRVAEEKIPFVVHHLNRVNTIFQHAINQFDVMETLDPQDFISFRDKLVPASGLQSYQYRMMEILLGIEADPETRYAETILSGLKRLTEQSPSGDRIWASIERMREHVTLRAALIEWLQRTPIDGSLPGEEGDGEAVDRFLGAYLDGFGQWQRGALTRYLGDRDPELLEARLEKGMEGARRFLDATDVDEASRPRTRRTRAGLLFIESYRTLPLLAWPRLLLESVVVLEERLLLWRTRHARMVERIIGQRVGTGGTSGADFLHQRNARRIFPELWEIRTILLPREHLPELRRARFYEFEA